jgi:hypothetical protein
VTNYVVMGNYAAIRKDVVKVNPQLWKQ